MARVTCQGRDMFQSWLPKSGAINHPLVPRYALKRRCIPFEKNQRRVRYPNGRGIVKTSAFLLGGINQKGEPLTIPLNFYELLHVSRGASKDAIYRSYERLISNPPDVGFSEWSLQARKSVLEGAIETLGTPTIRREYDERLALGAIEETVPARYVSGVLILLHEAGKYDAVISTGTAWLSSFPRHKGAKDVATVVSCSYVTSAREMIEARKSLTEATSFLERAKELLVRYHGSLQILDIVEKTLSDLGPRLAMEMISSTDTGTRHEGILLLPMALEGLKKESPRDRRSHQAWISYLDRVRQLLSADELIELFNVSEHLFTDARELYYVAVAHIAAGVRQEEPKLICTAKELLIKADSIAKRQQTDSDEVTMAGIRSRKVVEEQQRRTMARCCSELLLGDSGAAADVLGLRDDPVTCDRQMYLFIKNNSRGAETLLPGLCVLVERWTNEVALASFYKTRVPFSLNEWFESAKVVSFIENMEERSAGGMLQGIASWFVSPVINFFTNREETPQHQGSVEDAVKTNEKVLVLEEEQPHVEEDDMPQHEEVVEEEERHPRVAADDARPDYESFQQETAFVEEAVQPLSFEETSSFKQRNELLEEEKNGLEKNENEYMRGMENVRLFDDDDLPRVIDASSIAPIGGEDSWMKSAYEARRVRWGRVTATGLLLLAGLSAPLGRLGGHSIISKYIPVARIGYNASSNVLSRGQAYAIINKWQKIKSDALGKSHKTASLPQILGEPMSQEWNARAVDLKKKGIHYVHTKHECKIKRVRRISADSHEVTAEIRENIAVYKSDGSSPQTIPSSYRVKYDISYIGNSWKLMKATIQG